MTYRERVIDYFKVDHAMIRKKLILKYRHKKYIYIKKNKIK